MITRTASYSERQKLLSYWSTPNRTTLIDVKDLADAKDAISESGVAQNLKMVRYFQPNGKAV